MPSEFMIGTANNIYDFLPIDELLQTTESTATDPDWSFEPFTTSVRLANGTLRGNGYPRAVWRWNIMTDANRQTLRDLISTDLSGWVYIRTATNDVDMYGDIIFNTYYGIMTWSDQDEDIQADKVLGLVLTFTHLTEVV
jgi:hypothetical protein